MVDQYSELYETFRWHVPKGFNLATACCQHWSALPSHERRAALIEQDASGAQRTTTYAQLAQASAQLANGLLRLGVIPGDRVTIVLRQADDALTALLACWSIRAVGVTLAPDLDADALLPKFKQARSQVLLIDACTQHESLIAAARCPRIKQIVGLDVYDGRVMSWRGLIARQPDTYAPTASVPSDPALISWPAVTDPNWPAQSAMVQAHQTLIGQLPGFVAALDWFPEGADQVLTTLKPWDEAGLWAAILPALYFGHTVVLRDTLPPAHQWPESITHVVTTSATMIQALREPSALSAQGAKPRVIAVLGDQGLLTPWRERAQATYGCPVNQATFTTGAGLLLAQSQHKWPTDDPLNQHLVPGHRIRLTPDTTDTAPEGLTPKQIEVCRTDQANQTDPALFVQLWPVKDQLDVGAELPDWWPSGLYGLAQPDGTLRVLGEPQHWHAAAHGVIDLALLEQAALLEPEVCWCQALVQPERRHSSAETDVWVLVDVDRQVDRQSSHWRADLKRRLYNRMLAVLGDGEQASVEVRIGLVEQAHIPKDNPRTRHRWQTRATQALIEFV